MHLLIMWFCVYLPEGAINQYNYVNRVYLLARPNCALARKENTFLHKKVFNYTVYSITEQDTSLLDCKHKHMTKSGAPPDKVGVLQNLLPLESHGFANRIDV